MKFTLTNIFNTDAETFWAKVFFDQEYNRGLYLDELKFKRWELLELTGDPGAVRTRKTLMEPQSEAPAFLTKLVGGAIAYTEEGRFDPATKIWTYKIVTTKMSDKVSIGGKYWLEARGDKKVERFCDIDIKVDVFGVGGMVEKFLEQETRKSYVDATTYTNRYLAKNGL